MFPAALWHWDETEDSSWTLELCRQELLRRAEFLRCVAAEGIEMHGVEVAVCRAVAVKLLTFAIGLPPSELESPAAFPAAIEVRRLDLIRARTEIARQSVAPARLAEAIERAAEILDPTVIPRCHGDV